MATKYITAPQIYPDAHPNPCYGCVANDENDIHAQTPLCVTLVNRWSRANPNSYKNCDGRVWVKDTKTDRARYIGMKLVS